MRSIGRRSRGSTSTSTSTSSTPSVATVNVYSTPNGPDGDEVDALVAALLEAFPVRAVSLTAFDPACDVDDRVPPIALRVLRTIAQSL